MKRMMLTNCPNCAGELTRDGRCTYCGTHARFANELDIRHDNFVWNNNPIEIMVNIKSGDETIVMPVVGNISSMTIKNTPYQDTEVEFEFCGHVINMINTVKTHS